MKKCIGGDSDKVARRSALSYCFSIRYGRHVRPFFRIEIDRQPFRSVQDHWGSPFLIVTHSPPSIRQRDRPFPQRTGHRHVAQEEQHGYDIEQSAP